MEAITVNGKTYVLKEDQKEDQKEEKKYKFFDQFMTFRNKTVYRIMALKDFGDVKKGDLGGYIEKESNLSQKGNCWVYGDARVYDDAQVYGNARIYGNVQVCGKAELGDSTIIR